MLAGAGGRSWRPALKRSMRSRGGSGRLTKVCSTPCMASSTCLHEVSRRLGAPQNTEALFSSLAELSRPPPLPLDYTLPTAAAAAVHALLFMHPLCTPCCLSTGLLPWQPGCCSFH